MKKCAIVTGSASGIGRSIAETLANDGCDVVIADINENEGVQTAEEIGGLFVKSDLTPRESCRQLIEKAVTQYGRVDILVNNAGFQHVCPLEDFPEDKWDQMLSLMLTAPFLLTKYAWPYMKERQWGRVVNIASVHGLVASPYRVAYVSAKHGLLGLTRTGLWKAESTELQLIHFVLAMFERLWFRNKLRTKPNLTALMRMKLLKK